MTSQRNSFRMIVELDKKSVDEVNRRLKALGTVGAGRAMKNGFRKWSAIARKTVAASAPMGRMTGTETIRGVVRPNVHLKFAVATKIKGYSKGLVMWAAIGIKEIRGSYLTPHWYLRWVEYGHLLKRKATMIERNMIEARGGNGGKGAKMTVGKVIGKFFFTRAIPRVTPLVVPILSEAIDKEIARG